jgi:hypothetical protein
MKVKATERGFDGIKVREPGEVFDYEGKLGTWMEPIEEETAQEPAAKAEPKLGKQAAPKK